MQVFDLSSFTSSDRARARFETVDKLRRLLPKLAQSPAGIRSVPFGLAPLDASLPHGGLAFGTLHEIAPQREDDLSAAFGFIIATLGLIPTDARIFFVFSTRSLAGQGRPYGHGLNLLGVNPARAVMVETRDDRQALWAMEEILRAPAPAVVVGATAMELDLKTSQRLNLAAGDTGQFLLLLQPANLRGSSVAVTRWRIGAASSEPDDVGLIARWRWRVNLERCRNGRPGEWLVEFDHVAHRFSLASALAHSTLSRSAGAQRLQRTAG